MNEYVESIFGTILTGENWRRKPRPSVTLSATISKWTGLESNPGLRS